MVIITHHARKEKNLLLVLRPVSFLPPAGTTSFKTAGLKLSFFSEKKDEEFP